MNAAAPASAAAPAALLAAERALAEDRFEAAQTLCAEVIAQARAAAEPAPLGRALLVQARAELRQRHLLGAYEAASEAQEALATSGDTPRQLAAMSTRGSALALLGDAGRALEIFRRVAALSTGPGHAATRMASLVNLSLLLNSTGEHADRVQCLQEALALAQQEPALRARCTDLAARLATAHLDHAGALAAQGRAGDAAAQRAAAEAVLPEPEPQRWREFSFSERIALLEQIRALLLLGRTAAARSAAAAALQGARGPQRSMLGYACRALSQLHLAAGRAARAVAYAERAHALALQAGDAAEQSECLRELIDAHAAAGHWPQALQQARALRANKFERQRSDNRLRCRLAAMERRDERQRYQARQEQLHLQRLALIGRLIGQTHAALSGPIVQVRALAQQARDERDPAHQLATLQALDATVDRAAGLVSQLKLFSYRSSPQPMALAPRGALLQAWQGLAPHLGGRTVTLDAGSETPRCAWADAQRLGILLKVLLIELIQRLGATALRAQVASLADGQVELVLDAPTPAPPAADGTASLGLALCEEIAVEMGGALHCTPAAAGQGLRTRLTLRGAPASD